MQKLRFVLAGILSGATLLLGHSVAYAQTTTSDYARDVAAGQAALKVDKDAADLKQEVDAAENSEGDVDDENVDIDENVEHDESTMDTTDTSNINDGVTDVSSSHATDENSGDRGGANDERR